MNRESIKRAMLEGMLLEKSYKKTKDIIRNCFNGVYRKKLFEKIDRKIAVLSQKNLTKKTEIEPDKILFLTTRGSYNCNPRAIAEEIIRQNLPWKLVWVARKENFKHLEQYPKELTIVRRDSYEFYKEAASAKIWIDNSVGLTFMGANKKEEQILIETWHGSIGLKRFETSSDQEWIKNAKLQGGKTDYCISNSLFEDELYKNTFWQSAEILEYGHPRNDILLTNDENKKKEIYKKVYRQLEIPRGCKIAIYAPTFRDDRNLKPYSLNYEMLKNSLEEKFGGEWCIIVRLHFEIKRKLKKKNIEYPKFVIDATNYEDIQDLLMISDVGITDYSSWICDFVLTRRPAFFFATDLESFYDERGFYYPLESTPFPLAQDNEELKENILEFDNEKYIEECNEFISSKGCIDDGHASERVVEKLKELIKIKEEEYV